MAKVKRPQQILSQEEIEKRKEEFEKRINKSAEEARIGRRSPTKDLLQTIKDVLKKAVESNVSYKQISKDIEAVYGYKVSQQSIRAFVKDEFGIVRKRRGVENSEKSADDKDTRNETDASDGMTALETLDSFGE